MAAEVQGRGGTMQVGVTSRNEVHLRLSCGAEGLSLWLRPDQAEQLAQDVAAAAEAARQNAEKIVCPILNLLKGVELTAEQAEAIKRLVESRVRR